MNTFRPNRLSDEFPPVVKGLLIANILVYFLQFVSQSFFNIDLTLYFGLHSFNSPNFSWGFLPLQLFSCMFLHGGLSHLFFNMFALWMFGRIVEPIFKSSKDFFKYYIFCGVGAGILQLIVGLVSAKFFPGAGDFYISIGASGAIYGVLMAFAYFLPEAKIYVYMLIPVKAKYWILIFAGLELFFGVNQNPGDNVAHFAHIGGLLVGYILLKIEYPNKKFRQF